MFRLLGYSQADPEGGGEGGGRGPDPPLPHEKSQEYPLKNAKLPSQCSMVGHYRQASETPFQWSLAGGPMMAHF